MSFKSQAQRQKMAALVKSGKISQEKFNEWESKTPLQLQSRVTAPLKKAKKTKVHMARVVK